MSHALAILAVRGRGTPHHQKTKNAFATIARNWSTPLRADITFAHTEHKTAYLRT